MHPWKLESSTKWQIFSNMMPSQCPSLLCVHVCSMYQSVWSCMQSYQNRKCKQQNRLPLIPWAIKCMALYWIVCTGNKHKASLTIQPTESTLPQPFRKFVCRSIQNLKSFSAGRSSTGGWLTIFAQLMHRVKWVLQSNVGGELEGKHIGIYKHNRCHCSHLQIATMLDWRMGKVTLLGWKMVKLRPLSWQQNKK